MLQVSQLEPCQPTKQLVDMPHIIPVQFLVTQSAATMQPRPMAHGAQLPPQFMSVSSPSFVVFPQWSGAHFLATHCVLEQSALVVQAWPAAQGVLAAPHVTTEPVPATPDPALPPLAPPAPAPADPPPTPPLPMEPALPVAPAVPVMPAPPSVVGMPLPPPNAVFPEPLLPGSVVLPLVPLVPLGML